MNDFLAMNTTLLKAGYGSQAGTFLVDIIFGLLIFMVLIRFLLQVARADFHNPLSQTIIRFTTPMLKPFRKLIPGIGGIDMASLVLLFLLVMTKLFLTLLLNHELAAISANFGYTFARLSIISIIYLIDTTLWVYIIGIIILVIASWIAGGNSNPVLAVISQLTNPITMPIRRLLPNTHGIDFTPLIAMVLLTLVQMALPHLQNGFITMIS